MAYDAGAIGLVLDEISFCHAEPFFASISGANIDRLAALQNSGIMAVYGIFDVGEQIGAVGISVETDGPEKWIIVNALAAHTVNGVDMTIDTFRKVMALAKTTGCDGVRIWTEREGLRRKLEKLGAKSRYVMEVKIDELTV